MTNLQEFTSSPQNLQLQPQITSLPGTPYAGGAANVGAPMQANQQQLATLQPPGLLNESQPHVLSGAPAPNNWLVNPNGSRSISSKFPLNLAAGIIDEDTQKKVFMFMQQKYIWPMVNERRSFEPIWDTTHKLYRISMDTEDLNFDTDTSAGRDAKKNSTPKVSDSVIYDAIDRLANINHFISFKNRLPMQFQWPLYASQPFENDVYHPSDDKLKAGNCLLEWNASQVDFYRKHLICARHHYTYGVSYVHSGFEFKTTVNTRQLNTGQEVSREEIERIGTTFDPISIRRLWLDYRIPAWEMENQTCPFFFTETPHFAILQNTYNPDSNPFGFVNQDKLVPAQYMFAAPEYQAQLQSMKLTLDQSNLSIGSSDTSMPQVLSPDNTVNMLWTFFPMLPLDPKTGEWEKHADGTDIPMERFIVQTYGSNLATNQIFLRIQQNYYPKNKLPIYASCHMPDMDSGQYTPSIGQLLWNHYKEIVTCTNQFIANKDWINDPPAWIQQASPSVDSDLTRRGAKLVVNGPNDFGWRQPYDATASTVAMRSQLREEARTTSKAVDAILGKAMGSRTSATEASNVFQAAMSGVTTDINLFNFDISGNFARRIWDYSGLWFDPDLLASLTGQWGFALKPEDLWLNIGVQTNVGSIFIESVVKQQNIRYILESGGNDPTLNRAAFWKMLLGEFHFENIDELVNDQGFSEEVQRATMQAILAYQGTPIPINPNQNHQIAIKVKSSFLEDLSSIWNRDYAQNAQLLVRDVQLHQQFILAAMQQQMIEEQHQANIQNAQGQEAAQSKAAPQVPERAGQVSQAQGGTL